MRTLTRVYKEKPCEDIRMIIKKYGKDFLKPSNCYHIDNKGFDFVQCIKCGRIIFEQLGYKYYYLASGVRYSTRKMKRAVNST